MKQSLLAVCATLLCFLCVGCGNPVSGLPSVSATSTSVPVAATGQPLPSPTAASFASATTGASVTPVATFTHVAPVAPVAPATPVYPHLGDSVARWQNIYPRATIQMVNGETLFTGSDTRTTLSFTVIASIDQNTQRISSLTLTPFADTWNRTDTRLITLPLRFLPDDAIAQQPRFAVNTEEVWLWQSETLRATFPASYFLSNTGMATPGSITILYSFAAPDNLSSILVTLGSVYPQ